MGARNKKTSNKCEAEVRDIGQEQHLPEARKYFDAQGFTWLLEHGRMQKPYHWNSESCASRDHKDIRTQMFLLKQEHALLRKLILIRHNLEGFKGITHGSVPYHFHIWSHVPNWLDYSEAPLRSNQLWQYKFHGWQALFCQGWRQQSAQDEPLVTQQIAVTSGPVS